MPAQTVHLCHFDKFIPPFIEFVRQNIDNRSQQYYLFGNVRVHDILLCRSIVNVKSISTMIKLIQDINRSKKIIIHGLFDRPVLLLLFFQPWLLWKCYWVVWGGDLYKYREKKIKWRHYITEMMRRLIIKNMGYIVTQVPGDYALAKNHYNTRARYINSFVYPSNLYKSPPPAPKKNQNICVLLGNSASPSNDHETLFNTLLPYRHEDIIIYCPLSYGCSNADNLILKGQALYGEKFIALESFMPFHEYIDFLANIDIAVFAHSRQQAFGNIITLLGQGKKVYLKKENTLWDMFYSKNIKVFDIKNFDLNLADFLSERERNAVLVKELFSDINLCEELKVLLM